VLEQLIPEVEEELVEQLVEVQFHQEPAVRES
jgi:hypothetical protein